MGHMSLLGMLETNLDTESTMRWHLSSNFYPPVPQEMVEPCLTAVDLYNAVESDSEVALPDGVLWRGKTMVPASVLIEEFRLDPFLSEL